MEIVNSEGQTEITPDEKRFLKLPITTMEELNAVECSEIAKARFWGLSSRTLNTNNILSVDFIKKLHKRMFFEIWSWAGKIRMTDKNIGVPVYRIQEQLKCLIDDANYWNTNETFSPQEIAIRFHHKLVQIHVFNNGNGRHARLIADCFLKQKIQKVFVWGDDNILHTETKTRKAYLLAMKEADNGNYNSLLSMFGLK